MDATLRIEQQIEQAMAGEFADVPALRQCAFIVAGDRITGKRPWTVEIAADVALPSGVDVFSGSLFECDVELICSTTAVEDGVGEEARDIIGLIRDTIYGASFVTNVTARLSGVRLDAVQFAGGRPDQEGDAVTAYLVRLQCKVQKT